MAFATRLSDRQKRLMKKKGTKIIGTAFPIKSFRTFFKEEIKRGDVELIIIKKSEEEE